MKRTVYLIRHGEPDFPEGKRLCLGSKTDLPLSKTGRVQASSLSCCFDGMLFEKVYCSKLKRSIETADLLSAGRWPLEVISGIEELNCGAWEGLTFDEIREKYPGLYKLRTTDKSLPPPDGETYEEAAGRAMKALNMLMNTTRGDVAVVSHSGVNRAVLCSILRIPMKNSDSMPQECGCINVLGFEEGKWEVNAIGCLPAAF